MTGKKQKTKVPSKIGRPPQSGAFSLLTKGGMDDLPRKRRYLRPYLTGAREGWIRDIGGTEENLTTSQRILIDRAVTYLGCIRLVEEHLREKGIFKEPSGLLHAHLTQHYLAWNRALVDCLRLLGIDKKAPAEDVLTPLEIAAEIDAEKEKRAKPAEAKERRDPGQEAAAGGPGLAQDGRSAAGQDDGKDKEGADPGGKGQGGGKQASGIDEEGRSHEDEARDMGADQGGA